MTMLKSPWQSILVMQDHRSVEHSIESGIDMNFVHYVYDAILNLVYIITHS